MLIPAGIRIFYTDQLHMMLPADFILFIISVFYYVIFVVLFAIKLYYKHRILAVTVLLIYHKVKTSGIKQVVISGRIFEYLGNGDFFFYGKAILRQP